MYGKGISREGSLIDVGVEQSIIRKSGAWYTYDGDQLGQGKENSRNFLKEHPDVAAEIEKRILEKLGVGQPPTPPVVPPCRRSTSDPRAANSRGRVGRMTGRTGRGWDAAPPSATGAQPGDCAPRALRHGGASADGADGEAPPVDPRRSGREICLRQLSVRPRTRTELADAMRKRGIPEEVAAEVLDRYGEVGIIDDEAFARAWVTSRHHGRGLAKKALAGELRRRAWPRSGRHGPRRTRR